MEQGEFQISLLTLYFIHLFWNAFENAMVKSTLARSFQGEDMIVWQF